MVRSRARRRSRRAAARRPTVSPGRRSRASPTSSSPSRSSTRASARRAAPGAGDVHRERDVLGGGEVGEQVARGLLPDEADRAPPVRDALAGAHGEQVVARRRGDTGSGGVEAREDREQRRLARARRPDDGDHLAGLDAQVQALQRLHLDRRRLRRSARGRCTGYAVQDTVAMIHPSSSVRSARAAVTSPPMREASSDGGGRHEHRSRRARRR